MTRKDPGYWFCIQEVAKAIYSDGCTGVAEYYQHCCLEHDMHCRLGVRLDGTPITRKQADKEFRLCIQEESPLGRFSPMSWWRWGGVRLFSFYIALKRKINA